MSRLIDWPLRKGQMALAERGFYKCIRCGLCRLMDRDSAVCEECKNEG